MQKVPIWIKIIHIICDSNNKSKIALHLNKPKWKLLPQINVFNLKSIESCMQNIGCIKRIAVKHTFA